MSLQNHRWSLSVENKTATVSLISVLVQPKKTTK